jgi:hypothetical protein
MRWPGRSLTGCEHHAGIKDKKKKKKKDLSGDAEENYF